MRLYSKLALQGGNEVVTVVWQGEIFAHKQCLVSPCIVDLCSYIQYCHCRFVDMVIALRNCLATCQLPVYFNRKVNLLSEYKPSQLQRVAGYLKRVANKGRAIVTQ